MGFYIFTDSEPFSNMLEIVQEISIFTTAGFGQACYKSWQESLKKVFTVLLLLAKIGEVIGASISKNRGEDAGFSAQFRLT